MEIMLKTKQSGNSQFDFLHFDNELNPYYKHVVSMIKSGKYKPQEEEENMKKGGFACSLAAFSVLWLSLVIAVFKMTKHCFHPCIPYVTEMSID